jgi:hypothetical protein
MLRGFSAATMVETSEGAVANGVGARPRRFSGRTRAQGGNGLARSFGLVYSLPEELRQALRSNGKDLPEINEDESWELPVPATFVIASDRRLMSLHIDVDYRRGLAPEDIIASLKSLRSMGASVI